ncbi:uncharacterized protein [Nicotiana sylvestris]|uniref:uncharacterized protein n=1 Tax=Nicotiana sylvestris TaxID=4096 RepID=UPI00388CBBBB
MHDFIMAEDSELWDVICDGPYVPTKVLEELPFSLPKTRKEYTDTDRKAVEKNFHAKKILVCRIGPDEYNRISACETAEEIREALQTAHEGTTQVKQSKIDMLTTEYELFRMKDDEFIQDMHTRFTSIINELHPLGETIPRNKLVRKILSILPSSWEINVNAITKEKDLQELTIDELVGNLKTYEMKRKIDSERREPKKEKNLVLKADSNDSSEEDSNMAYLTKRFQKMVRRNGGMLKRGSSSKPKNYDLCHKCGKLGHFIKDCPLLKQEFFKYNPEKASKRNPVPEKEFKRRRSADNVVKQALVAWGDSSSEFEDETDAGDNSMMAVESEENEYDSTFALIAQSDDDEDDNNSEVNFRDVQRNLKSYSPKKLMSLANVLIDAYHSLVEDKDALTLELGEAERTRDDLVVCVVDLKETICELEKEKSVLTKNIANIEHERDDLVVVVVDHKETTNNISKEKEALVKRVTEIEEERDDLLVVVADLRETIEGLGTESKPENTGKGKEVASEEHIRLENEIKVVRTRLCVETEKNKHLQTELERGIGFQREETPYNPHSKYVTVPDNWLWNNGRKRSTMAHVQWVFKAHDWEHHGLSFTKSPNPQQNGVVERKNRTLKEMARTMLIDSGIAKNFRAEMVNTAFYLVNRISLVNLMPRVMKEYLWAILLKAKLIRYTTSGLNVSRKVFMLFLMSPPSCEKSVEEDQDEEPLLVPGEVINMTNGKAIMMSQVKEPSEDNVASSSMEPGTSITTTEAEETVVDVVQEPKNIKEALKDVDWITVMQDELHQFERNNVWHLVPRPSDRTIIGTRETTESLCEEFVKLMGSEFEMGMMEKLNFFLGLQVKHSSKGYLVDRKSTSGMAHFLGSCLISWGIRKQNSVALSTAEAKYVVVASCYAQLLWIKQQLEDFGVFTKYVPLLCDNTSALNMAKNPFQHKKTKHIDVRCHFLRNNVEKGLICMKFCSTEDQIADIFTKELSREHFERNRVKLGLLKSN